ncbi:hypothetical protein B0T18DRAFT_414147, partial [Schizothecium vesticola]
MIIPRSPREGEDGGDREKHSFIRAWPDPGRKSLAPPSASHIGSTPRPTPSDIRLFASSVALYFCIFFCYPYSRYRRSRAKTKSNMKFSIIAGGLVGTAAAFPSMTEL